MLRQGEEDLFRHGDRHIWCAACCCCWLGWQLVWSLLLLARLTAGDGGCLWARRNPGPQVVHMGCSASGTARPSWHTRARPLNPKLDSPLACAHCCSYLPLAHIYERFNFTLVTHFGAAAGFYR